MGIGLYTAYNMARLHHGSLEYRRVSDEGGSLFTFTLPDALNSQVIAIIEDDADMMAQIKEAIGTYFKTLCYYNGKDGYEGVMSGKPDLVVCDAMLPDMDGYEIIRRIKSDTSMACTPVIMLTALDDDKHQSRDNGPLALQQDVQG